MKCFAVFVLAVSVVLAFGHPCGWENLPQGAPQGAEMARTDLGIAVSQALAKMPKRRVVVLGEGAEEMERIEMGPVRTFFISGGLPMAADDAKKDPLDEEYAKFEGTWQIVSLELDGMKLPEETIKDSRLIIKGKEFTMKEKIATYKGTFTIDASMKPKTIDLKFTEGPEKGNTSLGIYELDGDDLKLCLTITAKDRPAEFATKAKSGLGLEVLKREKAKKE
jgi:uncharacterized protein (TIGR03067 family)